MKELARRRRAYRVRLLCSERF